MALYPKPFTPIQKIIRSVFLGRPNILADVDVNRQFEAICFDLDRHAEAVGIDNNVLFTGTAVYDGSGNLTYSIDIPAVQIKTKRAAFDVPAQNFANIVAGSYKSVSFYLLALQKNVTFADDPVMSGVNSDTFATALPAADNLVYYDHTVVAFPYPDVTQDTIEATVGGGYKLISILGGIVPTVVPTGGYAARIVTYSAQSVGNELKTMLGDNFNGRTLIENISHLLGYVKSAIPVSNKKGMSTHYTGPITGVWDLVSGRGIADGWEEWAIMDGRNLTVDSRGRSFIGWSNLDSDFNTLNIPGGTKTVALTESQNGPHNHVTRFGREKIGSGNGWWGYWSPGANGYNDPVTSSTSGSGAPHNNLHPYVVMLPVQKVQ